MKLLLVTAENEVFETITAMSHEFYAGIYGIEHCRDIKEVKHLLGMDGCMIAIYDTAVVSCDNVDELFAGRIPMAIPLCSLEQQAYLSKNENFGGWFLDKPVERDNFKETMDRALEFLKCDGEEPRLPLYQHYAQDFENFLKERFWQDVLMGIIKDIPVMAKGIRLREEELTVLPIIIEIKEWRQTMSVKEKLITLSMIKNVARRELLYGEGTIIQVKDDILVALVTHAAGIAKLTEDCLAFCEECGRIFSVSVCCCIGENTYAEELEDAFENLITLSRENITGERLMFQRFGVPGKGELTREPDLATWKSMLLAGEYDPMLIAITEYFFQATAANRLTFENLRRFSHDFQQILYVVLQEKGVPAHVVFDNEKFDTLWDDAADSLSELLNWIFWSVGEISKHLGSADTRQDKLSEITEYIRNNLSHELTRQELASRVHLSQSALARMFKNGTGMTLTEYIFNLRLETAKRLLQTTSIPIGEAAEKCGFRNYSYFYTRFKDAVGVSPSEYRTMYGK